MRSFSPDFDHNVMHARQLLRATRDIPANLVADEVQRSWLRSVGYGLNEHDRVLFNPVSSAKLRRICGRCVEPDGQHPHPTLGESIGMAAEVAHGSCTDVPPARK